MIYDMITLFRFLPRNIRRVWISRADFKAARQRSRALDTTRTTR